MEMQVAIEEFLKMIPDFELTDADAVTWAVASSRAAQHPGDIPDTSPLIPTHARHVAPSVRSRVGVCRSCQC